MENKVAEAMTAQQILDKQDLHWMYAPNGDHTKPLLHDCDCRFCDVEDRVLLAMEEYAKQQVKLSATKNEWVDVEDGKAFNNVNLESTIVLFEDGSMCFYLDENWPRLLVTHIFELTSPPSIKPLNDK